MIDTIIGNLQMKISNVHVRYEVNQVDRQLGLHLLNSFVLALFLAASSPASLQC